MSWTDCHGYVSLTGVLSASKADSGRYGAQALHTKAHLAYRQSGCETWRHQNLAPQTLRRMCARTSVTCAGGRT